MGIELAIGAGLAALAAGSSSYQAHEQRKEARKAAKEARAEQENLAALEAGKTPEAQTDASAAQANKRTRRSAIRRTILSRQASSTQKLGD